MKRAETSGLPIATEIVEQDGKRFARWSLPKEPMLAGLDFGVPSDL